MRLERRRESTRVIVLLLAALYLGGPAAAGPAACVGGVAGGFPCSAVDLDAHLTLAELGGGYCNTVWGWVDSLTGREYALVGLDTGTTFVDLGNPQTPVILGRLPTHTTASTWRDIKVYADHAYIVSEAADHGMQVFDLRQLRGVTNPPVVFVETAHYPGFTSAHTVAINEESGFAYACGTQTCGGGLHMIDLRSPALPAFTGCFSVDGYTHETQCVLYRGPDLRYRGHEICFDYTGSTLTVVDVTDKAAPVMVARTGYLESGYPHQGWLTEDQSHLLLDDEFDELNLQVKTRTLIWDVSDLRGPVHVNTFHHTTDAIDHNLYIRGDFVYESNYRAGLRILEIGCLEGAGLVEVGYFDVYPADDARGFDGSWGNFPYFPSGIVIASGIQEGLFVLQPTMPRGLQGVRSPGPAERLADLGNTLHATRAAAEAVLALWAPAPPGGGFNIHRGEDRKLATLARLGGSPSTTNGSYSDPVIGDGQTYYYQARGVDGCGVEGP